MNAQIFAIELEAIDGCDFAFNSFRCQIFNHLFNHLILDVCMVEAIRGEKSKNLPPLLNIGFRSFGNFQRGHDCRVSLPNKVSADGET